MHLVDGIQNFDALKQQYPDCLLALQMGDFYEFLFDDAKIVAKELVITLTKTKDGTPLAGVPYHAIYRNIGDLTKAGYRVALIDDLQNGRDVHEIKRFVPA